MHRRTFIALGGASLAAIARDWLIAPPAGAATHDIDGRRIVDGDVDALDQINADLRALDDRYGGAAILTQARAQVGLVDDMLNRARYTDRVGRHLYSSAAELLRLTGWMSFTASRHADADRYWTAALHAAHAAGDTATARNTLGFMSMMAKETGAGDDAVRIMDAALERRTPNPRLSAVLSCRAAQAHAEVGDRAAVIEYLDLAETSVTAVSALSNDPPSVSWMDDDYLYAMAGYAFLRLDLLDAAEHRLTVALRGNADRALKAEMWALLGQVHARRGDVPAAVETAGHAVDALLDDVRSELVARQVKVVDRAVGTRAPEFSARVLQLAS